MKKTDNITDNVKIDFQYLDAIKYHELEDKLTELGVKEAWVGGKKKIEIINDALDRLAKIKIIKGEADTDIEEHEVARKLELIKAQEQEADKLQMEAEDKAKLELETAAQKEMAKKELTPEQIQKSLSIIDINLRNNVKGQRGILLEKRSRLQKLLAETEE